jgi:hypothetical protein
MSSKGDMKMSLRLMTWQDSARSHFDLQESAHIFMSKVFEEFQLAVGSFRQYRRGERLHDLLHSNGLLGELVFGRADESISIFQWTSQRWSPTRLDRTLPFPRAADLCI